MHTKQKKNKKIIFFQKHKTFFGFIMYIYVSEPNKIGYQYYREQKNTNFKYLFANYNFACEPKFLGYHIKRYRPVTSTSSQVIFVLCWHELFASGENYENNN